MNKTIEKQFEKLRVKISETEAIMARVAGEDIEREIISCILKKDKCRMIFASAASQLSTLDYLKNSQAIPWNKVEAFHMDEYHTLPLTAPQRFGKFLFDNLFKYLPIGKFHMLCSDKELSLKEQILRYQEELLSGEIDICIMGIGENTHIAFNDPGVGKFNDQEIIKLVNLDDICRQQQVNDGAFSKFEEVPETAITLTIPTLINAKKIFCIVPGARKKLALQRTLFEKVDEKYPSTILQRCEHAILYFDELASPLH